MTAPAIETSKYELIVAAARHEIEDRGIVGLRVQEVARQANCSVSLIYKHFTSRDGLLAHVLTEDYSRNIRRWSEFTDGIEAGTGPVDYNGITIDFDISSFTQLTMSFAFMLIHNEMLAPDDQMDDARMRAFYRDLISRYLS
ncbi:MAG: TetR/AcrR family transcriptional regulator [Actinobacteria bacterium]|nr:TetR/AcrR family transcriptional regulator [Actinomycetota bacterium]